MSNQIQTIELNLFFDGTGNNTFVDNELNTKTVIADMYDQLQTEETDNSLTAKFYISGAGTEIGEFRGQYIN